MNSQTKSGDKDQRKRFEDAAREHGADESGKKFERAFGKILPPKNANAAVDDKKKKPGK